MDTEIQVDPTLISEIRKYGNFDVNGCYACGSCTVICSLSSNGAPLPRRCIRYGVIGLKEPLQSSLEPWLCYYCGDCSTSCPRQTEPGEAMMTLRRYLTSRYDWTGLSKRLYQSKAWQIGALLLAGIATVILIMLFHNYGLMKFGHIFEISLISGVALFVIAPNVVRMYWFTMHGKRNKIPIISYLTELKTLILHAVTQLRFGECKEKSRWLKHWFVAAGYVLMLTLIVFLGWFQTVTYSIYHPFRLFGYIVITTLIVFTIEIIIGRVKKQEQIHKFSHLSDWLFVIWLFMIALTALLVHMLLSLNIVQVGHGIYIFHLMILGQWALVIVPFGKWIHLIYRPLAIYFYTVREKVLHPAKAEI